MIGLVPITSRRSHPSKVVQNLVITVVESWLVCRQPPRVINFPFMMMIGTRRRLTGPSLKLRSTGREKPVDVALFSAHTRQLVQVGCLPSAQREKEKEKSVSS